MEFWNYKAMKNRCDGHRMRGSAADFRKKFLNQTIIKEDWQKTFVVEAAFEELWCQHDRPFFNVWPPIVEMVDKIDLTSVPADSLPALGMDSVLVRMPRSFDLYHWILLTNPQAMFGGKGVRELILTGEIGRGDAGAIGSIMRGTMLDRVTTATYHNAGGALGAFDYRSASVHATKLMALLCMIRRDQELFSPIVMTRDRAEYMITADEDRKRLLEQRAARKQGLGFDVGREWHETRDTSPHYRNAHLALFWTGKGRSIPVVKLRSGCVVNPRALTEMPTGYFGPETEAATH